MARQKCAFKWQDKMNVLMARQKRTFKWQDYSVRLNWKTKWYV